MRRLALALLLTGCPKAAPPPLPTPAAAAEDAAAGVTDPRLADLLRRDWDATMAAAPEWATWLGDRRFDDRLSDVTEAGEAAERARAAQLADAVEALAGLDEADAHTAALFVAETRAGLAVARCRFGDWSLSPRGNAVMDAVELPQAHTIRGPEDLETLLARYRAVGRRIDASAARLRRGLQEGRVATGETLRRTLAQVQGVLDAPLAEHPLLAVPLPADWPSDRKEAARGALELEVTTTILPATRRFAGLVRDELLPAGRDETGLGAVPGIDGCYEALIARHTTFERAPRALHDLGLAEIARLHTSLRALGRSALGTDDLETILTRLRDDPALRFATADEVLAAAQDAVRRAQEALPRAFGRLPQAGVEVVPIPEHEAPFTTIAYYRGGTTDGSRPGRYYVNTFAPETRPRFEAQVLAFHEAIPGHHLQIAIAQELPALPAFRRHGGSTAAVEGWALYSEGLADELGLYGSDLDRLGAVGFELWRAGRLVVDTGLHALGWTRQQAIDYLAANTPLARNNIDNEVDRYLNTPGQALAYKVGQLEIRALRAEAERAQGDRFDLRAFHDVLLGGGALPLPALRARVERWISGD